MKHKRIFSAYTQAILSVFLFLSLLCSNDAVADKHDSAIGEKIVGTYLLTEDDNGGSRIVTITEDGIWFAIHSYQFDNRFSNQQGSWKQSGEREITAGTLNFTSLKDGVSSSLFRFTAEFDKTFQRVSGYLSGKMFPPDADPLDPVAVPVRMFSNTFTGKRLMVTDN